MRIKPTKICKRVRLVNINRNLFEKQDSTFKIMLTNKDRMKSKPRKTIGIELICMSILCSLPFGGSSLQFNSRAQNNDKNHIKWSQVNNPTTFNVPIEDVNDYNEDFVHYRHRRSAPGKAFSISLQENLSCVN